MADRRGVRSASRRKTPTPQPPSKTNTPQPGRASRTRGLRSASRDLEPVNEAQKPTRRSARHASVTTVTDESDYEAKSTRRTKRRPAKEVVADLTILEEVDTQVDIQEAPETPTRTQLEENPAPFRSPGAASEMSGTTAITSFSMVEADFLDHKKMLKHMRKLCESSAEFLDHLAPDDKSLEDDQQNIHEIHKPDSDFSDEFRDFNEELDVHLKHYKTEEHSYIHTRAIHRALFGHGQASATQSGLDLILYLANLLIFAKQMIPSLRTDKEMWTMARKLDNSFPSQFMSSLISNGKPTITGESALLNQTFDLALELRTQLAILVLERSASEDDFNPDEVIGDVFLRSESSQAEGGALIRGWSIAALGGEDSALPQEFENKVIERVTNMREFFALDDESLDRGEVIDIEGLGNNFPWDATILRLLHWVRLRHRELRINIHEAGGAAAILRSVKQQLEEPPSATEQPRAVSTPRESLRKKRTSFGRDRRRSSRKFDPNAPVDFQAIDALRARERLSQASTARQAQEEQPMEPIEKEGDELPVVEAQQDDDQPIVGEEDEEQPIEQPAEVVEDELEGEKEPEATAPPGSSAALFKALKRFSKPGKENRGTSIFDRQSNAQRVDFGDGFDTQPTPGPSTKNKGKQRAQPASSRKRARTVEIEDDSEDDAFETEDRTARAQERRQRAPVTKKVRIDPTSSAPPTSHQPPPRSHVDKDYQPEPTQEESISETEAPDMTEEPPSSMYQAQRRLAKQARAPRPQVTERKAKTAWTENEENALAEYMEMYPAKYAAILRHDRDEGNRVLQDRDQVALKDKARIMAKDMIKSGCGLMPGFENIIQPTNKLGKALIAQGYTW
ncbi:hypothetical protein CC86DRAFT_193986 [Ophiobolus disseminans]|uniref:Myb-like domain-containing protein n=1 Tax=Ophiobolus disseminans TaxID=1469910 RepID=A0A6A7A5S4_9PLEO|nr:hypothetical protein CC86DRAFT_193986 [Ophiobolus disseminans]